MFLQGQISLPLLIYNVFTWTNQSPFIDLKYFYRVKSVSLSSSYKVFRGSNQFHFFFLQGFYRVKTVSLYRFTRILQVQTSLPFLTYNVSTGSNQSLFFSTYKVFTGPNQCLDLHDVYTLFTSLEKRFTGYLQR